jgi:iron complex transport system ATP-binding protein
VSLLTANKLSFGVSERLLCKDLLLSLDEGECWAVLGPNGSGKTTLLHALAGLHPLLSGEITLKGQPLEQLDRRQIAQQLGLMLQDSHDPFPATVEETALSGRHPFLGRWQNEGPADRSMAREALEQMELTALAQRQVQTLSGGERRRLAFATLLTQGAPLMLLDEPLNHLDLRHQQLLLQAVRNRCHKGDTVMMVLHDPNQAVNYCDRALLLHGDGSWQAGDSGDMLTAEKLSGLFGCRISDSPCDGKRWFHTL